MSQPTIFSLALPPTRSIFSTNSSLVRAPEVPIAQCLCGNRLSLRFGRPTVAVWINGKASPSPDAVCGGHSTDEFRTRSDDEAAGIRAGQVDVEQAGKGRRGR